MQLAATRCNSLQLAATRCNTILLHLVKPRNIHQLDGLLKREFIRQFEGVDATSIGNWPDHGCPAPTYYNMLVFLQPYDTQHTATPCNTLQGTIMMHNTLQQWLPGTLMIPRILQHTTTHCQTSQHTSQFTANHCSTLQHTATYCPCDTLSYLMWLLQHTATHCHILQHTATHCNTLQHTATYCKTLQRTAHMMPTIRFHEKCYSDHCNTLHHTATHCIIRKHTAAHCNTLQHTATHCNTLQQAAARCSTLQHIALVILTVSFWWSTGTRPESNRRAPWLITTKPRRSQYLIRYWKDCGLVVQWKPRCTSLWSWSCASRFS